MKKSIITFLMCLTVIFAASANAEIKDIRISDTPHLDGHSVLHFWEGFIYTSAFRVCGASVKGSVIGGACMSVFSEVFRDGYQNEVFGIKPDRNGIDLADIGFNFLGVFVEPIFEICFNGLTKKKINVEFVKSRFYVSMNL